MFYYKLRKAGLSLYMKHERFNDGEYEYLLILPFIPNLPTLVIYININPYLYTVRK
jgi:hypothetical protein